MESYENNKKTIRLLILGLMSCIVLHWLLTQPERLRSFTTWITNLVAPFLVGACIAFILNVPMRGIETFLKKHTRLKSTRSLSILLTVILLLVIVAIVMGLVVPQVQNTVEAIAQQFPKFLSQAQAKVFAFLEENPDLMDWVVEYTDLETLNWVSVVEQAVDLVGDSLAKILNGAVSAIGNVISGVWSVFVSLVFCFSCLGNKEQLARQSRRILYSILRERWADEVVRVFRLANSTFSNFLSGQCIEVCILGGMFAVAMSIFRMPYVPLVSVLVAVTAFIPIVGAWIGCILGAFFILVNNPIQAVWFVILFLVLQQLENNLVYPRVVGTSVGLPSMWVLFSVSIGGKLMGVAGMVLMIPMVSVIYALIRDYTAKRVAQRQIDVEKLKAQPPELKSKLKEKREVAKRKREAKRAAEIAEMMRQSLHIPDHHSEKEKKNESSGDGEQ